MRKSEVVRKTKETDITVKLNIDGEGKSVLNTGIGFFDHMLNALAKHSGMDLDVTCKGDLNVDTHHSIEDTGIVIGEALNKALGDKAGINRYASFTMAMDDALVMCAIDLSGRSYYESNAKFDAPKCGEFETECTDEFFRSFADNAKMNLHFVVLRGVNAHHIIEAMFKSLAKCLRDAVMVNPNIKGSLSTKGVI
ncbi:MAG: imidazoleglycerol-phosphate dehydratase HisB [Acholeplasmatales bacterium]|nr:imidazoleglycerol-phosphate dehydratase HisB [Acholeplasmatales bacterium]